MALPATIMYIISINALAIFVRTRRTLKKIQHDDITQREKMFHGFNVLGFVVCIYYVSSLLLLEAMFFTIAQFDQFLIDFFSVPPMAYLSHGLIFVVAFILGYGLDPLESHVPLRVVSDGWVSLIIFLTLLTGILGLLTGILI